MTGSGGCILISNTPTIHHSRHSRALVDFHHSTMRELKEKSNVDLQKMLTEKRKALRVFRFSVARSKIKNIKEGKNLKKDIARILTEARSRTNR